MQLSNYNEGRLMSVEGRVHLPSTPDTGHFSRSDQKTFLPKTSAIVPATPAAPPASQSGGSCARRANSGDHQEEGNHEAQRYG
jgi:hypothetical protein